MKSSSRQLLLAEQENYSEQVRNIIGDSNIVGYWPLGDRSGTTALEVVNARNGTTSGATVGQPGIGDGKTAYSFDGVNDIVTLPAAQMADFDGGEGAVIVWWLYLGNWGGAGQQNILSFSTDSNNRIHVAKSNSADTYLHIYEANGNDDRREVAAPGDALWHMGSLTWTVTDDYVRHFLDGVQFGADHTSIGAWAGPLSATRAVIGGEDTTPNFDWYGRAAHALLAKSPLSDEQHQAIYRAGVR